MCKKCAKKAAKKAAKAELLRSWALSYVRLVTLGESASAAIVLHAMRDWFGLGKSLDAIDSVR